MALAPSGTGGSRAMYGIFVRLDASGVVTGATLANQSLSKIKTTARRTARQVDSTNKSLRETHQAALQASAGLASVGFAVGFTGKKMLDLVGHATKTAMGFEVAMSKVQHVTMATGKELDMLTGVMVDMGLKTIETPTSAADAFRKLRTAGIETKDALEMLPKVIQMVTGAGGLMGMDAAVRTTLSAFNKFRHEGIGIEEMADNIAHAARATALGWEHMPAFFNSLGAAPMKLKATMAQMLALGGVMKAGGMQAAQSGQALNIFSERLISNERRVKAFMVKKGLKTKDEFFLQAPEKLRQRMIMFQKMRVDLFDQAGKLRNLDSVLSESLGGFQRLYAKDEGEALTALSGVFGDKAGQLIMMLEQLKRKGIDADTQVKQLTKTFKNAPGAAEAAEKAYLKTAEGIAKLIEGSKLTIATIFGQSTMGIVSRALQIYKSFLNKMLAIVEANPALAKAIMITTTALGALAVAAGLAAVALAATLFWAQVLGPALGAAGVGGLAGAAAMGFAALKKALIFTVVPLVAIAKAFVVLYLLMRAWEWIWTSTSANAERFREIFTSIKLVMMGVVEWWNGTGGPNSMKLGKLLDERGLSGLVAGIVQVKWVIVQIFSGIWKGIKQVAAGFAFVFGALGMAVLEGLGTLIGWFSAGDARTTGQNLKLIGQILGWFVIPALIAFKVHSIAAGIALAFVGNKGAVASLKIFWIVAAVIAAVAAYTAAINYFMGVGEELGPKLWGWIDVLMIKIAKLALWLAKAAITLVNKFTQPFRNGWDGFIKWLQGQGNVLKAVYNKVTGQGKEGDVTRAMEEADKINRVAAPDIVTDRMAELAIRDLTGADVTGEYDKEMNAAIDKSRLGDAYVAPTYQNRKENREMFGGAKAGGGKLASAGPMTMNITVNGSVTDENARLMGRTIADQVSDQYDDETERGYY